MSKSQESLDSPRQELSEDDSEEETQSDSDENISSSVNSISPHIVRKHK